MSWKVPENKMCRFHILVGSASVVMAGAMITPALPSMEEAYSSHRNATLLIQMLLSITALSIGLGAALLGTLSDRWGRKKILIASVILFAFSGGAGFFVQSIYVHLLARMALGFAYAGMLTTFTTLIADYYSGKARESMMGLQSAFIGIGAIVFLSIGGFMADISWRHPFLIYFLVLALLPGILFSIKEPVVLANASSNKRWQQLSALPWATVAPIYLLAFFNMIFFFMIFLELPFQLTLMSDVLPSQIGLALSLMTAVSAVSSAFYRAVRKKFSFFAIFSIIFLSLGIAYFVFANSASFSGVLVGLVIAGFGFGLLMPNTNTWLATEVPHAVLGSANGCLNTCVFLGQFSSPLVIFFLKKAFTVRECFEIAGVLMLLVHLVFWTIQLKQRKRRLATS